MLVLIFVLIEEGNVKLLIKRIREKEWILICNFWWLRDLKFSEVFDRLMIIVIRWFEVLF